MPLNISGPHSFAGSASKAKNGIPEQHHIQGLTLGISRAFLDWYPSNFSLGKEDAATAKPNDQLLAD